MNQSPRIVFAGTPDFAASHLQALLDAGYNPVAVYTQPDRPAGRGRQLQASAVKQVATEFNIDCFQPASLKSEADQQQLAALKPDLMIVVAYGLLLPKAVLDIPRLGCINVHASLLPRWRGAAPIHRAIEAGDQQTGVTIMQMDVGLDTGDMLLKKTCPINLDDTSQTLHDRLTEIGSDALIEALPAILTGTVTPECQDESQATYAHKLNKSEATIDWNSSAIDLDRKIRAFTPWPGSSSEIGGQTVKLNAHMSNANEQQGDAGEILRHGQQGLIVQCGTGQLAVSQLQFPGKRMTDVSALLNAYPDILAPGQHFKL